MNKKLSQKQPQPLQVPNKSEDGLAQFECTDFEMEDSVQSVHLASANLDGNQSMSPQQQWKHQSPRDNNSVASVEVPQPKFINVIENVSIDEQSLPKHSQPHSTLTNPTDTTEHSINTNNN